MWSLDCSILGLVQTAQRRLSHSLWTSLASLWACRAGLQHEGGPGGRVAQELDVGEPDLWHLCYCALFLLVWGEAANVRFMPECLCYIFHHVSSVGTFLGTYRGRSLTGPGCAKGLPEIFLGVPHQTLPLYLMTPLP